MNFNEIQDNKKKFIIQNELTKYSNLSSEAKEFIIYGLDNDPKKRSTSQQMLGHCWLSN